MAGVLTAALADNADAVAAGSVGGVAISRLTGFNGSTWDRIRTLDATANQGLGRLTVTTAMPAAGVTTGIIGNTSSSSGRATLVTPTSGKRIRIISWNMASNIPSIASNTFGELYFGTGTNISTNTAKAIGISWLSASEAGAANQTYPDGSGPVGAADDVLSIRASSSAGFEIYFIVWYREE